MKPLLGINIDHIATLRQLRGTPYPDIVEAALAAVRGGADQITVHLREDRRHIQEEDVRRLRETLQVPLNLEMAVTPAMIRFAVEVRPDWVCLVPEKRREVTTEGGLDVQKAQLRIQAALATFKKARIRTSCFVEPSPTVIRLCRKLGADAVELHTGKFCTATQGGFGVRSAAKAQSELERIRKAAVVAARAGLQVHAGHGFDYENIKSVCRFEREDRSPLIQEYNIGHSVICRGSMVGLENAVKEMVALLR